MLTILVTVILFLALGYAGTRHLALKNKLLARVALVVLTIGPTVWFASKLKDEALPGSAEVTVKDMQKALPASPK